MATTPPFPDELSAMAVAPAAAVINAQDYDPFRSAGPTHHRFSNFNAKLFALGPNASPAQAKRALEAHLAETDRRMEEAGKLGTALVQQRAELTERLEEVEKLEAEDELSDDLRQKLIDIEKDYNEVARESARAFLPKSRVPSNEAAAGSPFVPESRGGKRSVSPSKFEAQATASPTKLSVPNRKIRNQPANRNHDIQFAAEISSSLIVQVRNLQVLLAEKEEELKEIRTENSKLEYEAEGFQQRLKALDDNEHRYKDENWNLETQIHDLMAKDREAADREKKLTQALNLLQSEKNSNQRELDEIKLSHSKLVEEHAAVVKHHDIELGTVKRSIVMAESERAAMQRRIEDLTGQNSDLAKAMSISIRAKKSERESIVGMSDEDFHTAHDNTTPEQSPPASPVKGTPRHSMLESETLKTSLAHAQRLIQSLRTNVHREKTEKMESRRLLQEARDEIEKLRSDPQVPNRRARKMDSREFKKPPRLLGGLRSARSEIFMEDPNWEDQPDILPHPRSSPISRETTMLFDPVPEHTEHFETANETSDAAFETANENATETDDFHTGAEEFSSDDVETETESPSKRRTLTGRPPNLFGVQRSGSIHSTASTEDEDFPYEEVKTPTSLPPLHAKFPLRVSRGAFRRSRQASEEPALLSSPASFATSSNMGTPQQPAQSLAAELGDFDGSDNESNMSATPSRRSVRGRAMTPPPALPPLPRVIMIDSGMMTEPLYESFPSIRRIVAADRPISTATVVSGFSMGSDYSDSATHDLGEKLAEFPTPPTSSPRRDLALAPSLALSTVHSHDVEPHPEPDTHTAELAALRAEHAEQLKDLVAKNDAAHVAAIELLKSEHANQLNAAKDAHAQQLEVLRSEHVDATNEMATDAQAAHTREIELMTSRHADEISKTAADALASYNQELESLKILHIEQLAQKESEIRAAFADDLEALKKSHAEELIRREEELQTGHAAELDVLKDSHVKELALQKAESEAAHGAEIEALQASHVEELSHREVEAKAARDAEIEALTITHAEKVSQKESELKATASAELEALKLNHAQELSKFRDENDTVHAAELAALVASHASKIDATKSELSEAHTREFEGLKSSHADEIDQIRQSMGTSHSEQLESLKASHQQLIEEIKASINATHAEELESLQIAHAQQLLDTENKITAAQTAAIASLADSHSKQLDDTKGSLQSIHSQELEVLQATHLQELESLKATHSQELSQELGALKATYSQELESLKAAHSGQVEDLGREKDAAHTATIRALTESHNKQTDEIRDGMAATHAQELERLKASHIEQLEELRKEKDAAHAAALAVIVGTHAKQLESQKAGGEAAMSREIVALKAAHAQEIETLNNQHAAAHAKELDAFKAALAKQVESSKTEGDAARNEQIEALNAAHAEIIEAHKRDAENAQNQALEALKSSHERQIDTLKSEHVASRTKELELIATKHLDELKDLKDENAVARTTELESLVNKHLGELKTLQDEHETSKSQIREELGATHSIALEGLVAAHVAELKALKDEHEASTSRLREELGTNHLAELKALREELDATHSKQLSALRQEVDTTHSKDIDSLGTKHAQDLEALKSEHEATLTQRLQELADSHLRKIAELQQEAEQVKSRELAALSASHAQILDTFKGEHESNLARKMQEIAESHTRSLEELHQQNESDKSRELVDLATQHNDNLEKVKSELESVRRQELADLESAHATALASLRAEHQTVLEQGLKSLESEHSQALEAVKNEREVGQSEALSALGVEHSRQLDQLKTENDATLNRELDALKAQHAQILASQIQESDASLARELDALKAEHVRILESQAQESDAALARELDTVKAQHVQVLEAQVRESDAALARALDTLKAQHAQALEASDAAHIQQSAELKAHHGQLLESHIREATAEKEGLLASHAAEIKALRASLTVAQPALGYSSMSSVQTEPIELPLKSPRREAFIIPRDGDPVTPRSLTNGGLDKRSKATDIPIIAEDDTRQSPSAIIRSETPDSQRPFKEITTNTDARSSRKPTVTTSHQSSQTMLTAEGLDELMKNQQKYQGAALMVTRKTDEVDSAFDEAITASPSTVRIRRSSTDSSNSIAHAKHRVPEPGSVAASESVSARRPGSSTSVRSSTQSRPPLPPNHREVIEAARSNSAHGAKGTMGPPILPASAYRPSSSRPQTPSNKPPQSPVSVIKATPTPAPRVARTPGYADIQSPSKVPMRSRQSSISSFASEIDTRFNIHNGMGMGPSGFGPNTDPRMIQAVTQTMIGEYLWKYTRKTGRGEMSENRHRRFFWVHPYTRALYWSDSDPAGGNRGEMKAKSVPIEAVRVVADDNPMPPGLHRKSLVVIARGRTIKFTCTTGQRHETWFNALSYLLLRSGNENKQDAEEVAGNITQEDVDEFNPSIHRRPANGHRPHPPPSLSSYNSRTTRNESPNLEATMSIPTLTPTHEKEAARAGTFGRLSGYWKSTGLNRGTFSSLRSRNYQPYDSAIYEASEVPDSAEDLRQIIEQQDRESDKLENVRACCDGKHDVGTLSHTAKRGRLPNFQSNPHTHPHPGPSGTQSVTGSTRSRV
ncbi:hypothetical protein GQX73_g1876 [Xylaria multiplex]|uniref:PH domain-containing protein n=1 Tax=Xylaria multiplex TaxID=323545 RepID=A0A7C8NBZ2_9PEZI|nr:hypothetical protein GQX73_g1876 [Xylaria multiplex]